MTEIEKLFVQEDNVFTIFVVEQRFVVGRGHNFFHSFLNTTHLMDTDEQILRNFTKAVETISKNIAPVEKLIKLLASGFSTLSITDAISTLCKLYTVNEHQIAGPEVIDPIILQEGKITKKIVSHLVSLNKDSIFRPTIIVLLKDNDFERAKGLLSECPDGINVKMIWNSGREEYYKVVNCGADDVESFIESFSKQCYSTCSNTKKNILLNEEWSENSIVKKYSPQLLKIRTNLILDQKEEVVSELSGLIETISSIHASSENESRTIRSFECISKLFRIFAKDFGGQDIVDAEKIARELNHEILLAHVYRYAEFLPNCSVDEKLELYEKGYKIFQRNSMEDHAIYCKNNMLIEQFYTNHVRPEEFREMQLEAVNNVPGMVGLSHIYNNVGVAYLYSGHVLTAIDFFNKGMEYAKNQSRIVQYLALETNKMIAESYSYSPIDENRIRCLMRRLFDSMGKNRLPFLAADYALNMVAVAYKQNISLGKDLIHAFPISELLQVSFNSNIMNSGERCLQLRYLDEHFNDSFPLLRECKIPAVLSKPSGKRMEFILQHGLNPFDFETWV